MDTRLLEKEIIKRERRLAIYYERLDNIKAAHKGRELTDLTYWASYNYGYLQGKISELESTIEMLNNLKLNPLDYDRFGIIDFKKVQVSEGEK